MHDITGTVYNVGRQLTGGKKNGGTYTVIYLLSYSVTILI